MWRSLFRIVGGQIGLFATLQRLKEILARLERIANDEDLDALKEIRDSGEIDQIEQIGKQNFAEQYRGFPTRHWRSSASSEKA